MTETNNNNKPAKTWLLTINYLNVPENPNDIECIKGWLPECTRVVLSREVGAQGTVHLQGAITFRVAKRLSALKKLHGRAHWIIANSRDPFTYCIKSDSDVKINHESREQGRRTDIEAVAKKLKTQPEHVVAEENPEIWVRYRNGLKQWLKDIKPPVVRGSTKVYWVFGAGGAGKGKWMREMADMKGDSIEIVEFSYFRGYKNQTSVLLHDLRPSSLNWEYLLNLLDKWLVCEVPTYYGTAKWPPQNIFISAPMSPLAFAQLKTEEEAYQLVRRIDVIVDINEHI